MGTPYGQLECISQIPLCTQCSAEGKDSREAVARLSKKKVPERMSPVPSVHAVCVHPVCVHPVCVNPVCMNPVPSVHPVCVHPVCVHPVCMNPVCKCTNLSTYIRPCVHAFVPGCVTE